MTASEENPVPEGHARKAGDETPGVGRPSGRLSAAPVPAVPTTDRWSDVTTDDIVDFVERTTAAIWDHKNPGLISRWYTPTTVVHTSDGDVFGSEAVTANSIQKMAAFPDIRDYVEDTIWVDRGDGTFLTSMRWTWTGRNLGWSRWGPPTGRTVSTRGIANCIVRDGRYVEEWVAYDELTTLDQLGVTVGEELAAGRPISGAAGVAPSAVGEIDRLDGQELPGPLDRGNFAGVDDVEWDVRHGLHEIWNRRMIGTVDEVYTSTAAVHGPHGRELYGTGDIKQDVLAMLAMLPDAALHVDEVYSNPAPDGECKVAVRWTLAGTHTGPSRYGPPSGRRVRVMGLSHQRRRDGRIAEEWTVFSELSLLRQIAMDHESESIDDTTQR